MDMKQEEFVSFVLEDTFVERVEVSSDLEQQLLSVPIQTRKEKSKSWMAVASVALLIGVNAFAISYNSKATKKQKVQEAYSVESTYNYSYEEY